MPVRKLKPITQKSAHLLWNGYTLITDKRRNAFTFDTKPDEISSESIWQKSYNGGGQGRDITIYQNAKEEIAATVKLIEYIQPYRTSPSPAMFRYQTISGRNSLNRTGKLKRQTHFLKHSLELVISCIGIETYAHGL
jgi:hypothetical protein